ncbi:MAG: T9SS type A sorting domain-containing protein [Bacteroidota bacterium]
MKSLITNIKGAALAGALLSFLLVNTVSAQQASFLFSPASVEVLEGASFETQVLIETGDVPFTVFDLHLAFDSEYLQVMEIEILDGNSFNYHVPAEFSNANGRIDAAAFKMNPEIASGTMAIANVTFMALTPTELTQVKHLENTFPRSIIAYGGESVTGNLGGLDVTVLGNALSDGIQNDENGSFKVWPNPAKDIAQISFELENSEQVSLEIYSLEGKLIQSIFSGNVIGKTSYQYEIDISNLAAGNYNCRLLDEKGNSRNRTLTVIR